MWIRKLTLRLLSILTVEVHKQSHQASCDQCRAPTLEYCRRSCRRTTLVKIFVEIISRMTCNSRNSRKSRPAKFKRYTVYYRKKLRHALHLVTAHLHRQNQVAHALRTRDFWLASLSIHFPIHFTRRAHEYPVTLMAVPLTTVRLLPNDSTYSCHAVGTWKQNRSLRSLERTKTPRPMTSCLLDIQREREAEAQTQPKPAPPSRFAPPMSDSEVQQAKKFAVPKRTTKDTAWCISLWEQWRKARNSRSKEQVPSDICMLTTSQLLQYWLSRFVLEVRKKDGQEYPPGTLYHIVCGIMRFLRQNGKPELDFFKERLYADFRTTLDAEMKRLKQAGIGSEKRQPEPLTKEE